MPAARPLVEFSQGISLGQVDGARSPAWEVAGAAAFIAWGEFGVCESRRSLTARMVMAMAIVAIMVVVEMTTTTAMFVTMVIPMVMAMMAVAIMIAAVIASVFGRDSN